MPLLLEYDSFLYAGNNIDISSLFHRWMTLLSISLAIVFVVLLTFLSLISGALGSSPSDTPSTRSDTSNCAGRALMWYADTMDCFQPRSQDAFPWGRGWTVSYKL